MAQTEELINTDLDVKQNGLIQVMLVTSFLQWINLCYTTVTGMFAMNLRTFTRFGWQANSTKFYVLNAVCSAVCVVFTAGFAAGMRRLKLLGGGADVDLRELARS